MRQQEFYDFGMTLGGSPHQRGLAFILFARIGVRTSLQEDANGVDIPGARGGHEDGFAFGCRQRVRIGARFEQGFDHRRASGNDGFRKRRRAVAVDGFGVCASAEKQIHEFGIIPVSSPM